MFVALLTWIVKSHGMKTASAAAGGSILSVALLMGVMDKNVDQKIETVVAYVDSRHDQVSTDIRYIKEDQGEIKDLLKIINQRVYELNVRSKEK